jgi:hypothetical protein
VFGYSRQRMSSTAVAPHLLARYSDLLPIRSRGAFQILSARRVDDSTPCVLVLPGTTADRRRVATALEEVERAHALIEHPLIPRVTARMEIDGEPYMELACDAVMDGIEVMQTVIDAEHKIPYAAADAFMVSLRYGMEAAHAIVDPRTGTPYYLGGISAANVLFNAKGQWFLVGFGHNFPIERDDGSIDPTMPFFRAQEVLSGGPPSAMGDYVALLKFVRSMTPYVEMPETIKRILQGDFQPTDMELIEHLRWVDQRVIGEIPFARPSIAEAINVANRIRELLGVTLDPEGFAAYMANLLQQIEEPIRIAGRALEAPLRLTMAPGAIWIAGPDGARHRLGRNLRGIVMALVTRHPAVGQQALSVWDMLEAGWPGERPSFEAGTNRVYVTVNRLRNMGLRDIIERSEDGYRLAPRTTVHVVADERYGDA